jgi:phage terminase large subunit
MTTQKSKFIYTSALRKIRKMNTRIKVIQGGTSASKTFSILAILIDKAIKTPNLEISIVSESIPHLRRGANKDFLKIMKETGRFIPSHYNKTLLRYEFSNGSYIEFFSADDESRLRGARRNVLYMNECNNINYDAYLQLQIRTDGEIYLDYNPTSKFWVHTEVLGQPDTELLVLTYKDNEALSNEIVKQLEVNREKAKTSSYWENWCRVYLDGEIGAVEGTIFTDYEIIDRIPEEARLLGYGLDFGFSQDPAALIALYKYNDDIVVDEVVYQTGLLNSELANLMKQYQVTTDVYCDSAEPKSIQELKRFGFKVKPVEKGRDSVNYGIQILQQKHILVTRRSTNLLDEFSKYMWKKNRDGGYDPTPIDAYNHACDALRYVAMMTIGIRKENKVSMPFRIMKA